ncbi:transforming growth factor beta-1 proprotein [Anopheles funestus]|uniref:transforming growth factor beta-1 proprotein n=1 Tax=Anopheles funestus TaxID=62324 RepID=UPI0020C5C9DD|nr:transforming growth factor beta-1 proprotein [Anopheles funestus]XP_049291878.1 transforming growth factor beta-1 proprotein [Anopheles funestus]XP_049291879.1 transforming growth factor beta-1 proprotein [Anopheles funestus]XP_049291880.1 transforming growth factor beta-1 proprotein [Anopheles funestus]XP_049291881.1 transforming growth factor beta-1 proprotein [Anopheles funestus]
MMRVSSNSRLIATSHSNPGRSMGSGDASPADDDILLAVGFKRTLHTPVPAKQHTYSYPHHHHYCPRSAQNIRRGLLRVSKFLSFLLFLVICDSQTVSRAAFRTSAATIGHMPGADVDADSIISDRDDGGADGASTSGAAINHTKLQEIVLEGLGLSALPDVRMMNISQQEYETKYAEYLDRVNRRRSLTQNTEDDGWYEERHLFSFPGTDHALNHRKLRRKRSLNNDFDLVYIRFDIPTRNASTGEMTGFQSPSLYHDPRAPGTDGEDEDGSEPTVVDNPTNALEQTVHHAGLRGHRQSLSELPPISPENIEESSLNIMLTRRQNSARSTNAHSKQQHHAQQPQSQQQAHQVQQSTAPQSPAQLHQHQLQAHGHRRKGRVRFKQHQHHHYQQQHQQQQHPHPHQAGRTVTIHVYQLVEPYERHFLTSKTVAVQEIPPNGSRWYQLPLEEAVRTWLDGSRKNLGLELYCEGCHAHDVHIVHDSSPYFRSYDETPVLNVVGRLVQREKRSKMQRYRPQMRDYLSPPKTTACTAGNKRCCRHPLLVDFRDIEGFDFIIQPKIFDAGFCRGRCPTKFNPATHHALLQSLLHEHIKYDVPKPCCAPSSLDHIDVLHADPKNPQRLKVSTWHNMRVLECACS